jgi:hypothetical protein
MRLPDVCTSAVSPVYRIAMSSQTIGTQAFVVVCFNNVSVACNRLESSVRGADCRSAEEMFVTLAQTLLQQAHLSPVPLEAQPVYWQVQSPLAV